MVTFKNSIFKNETERLSFMQNFLKRLIKSNLLDKSCQKTKMANGNSGCYLSHKHGRLPELMSIGLYTYEEGDYAFLRFWESEGDEELNELISKREFFLEKNENKVKELLGNDIVYESNNRRRIGNFSIEEDDYWKGFCVHGKIRKSRKQLLDDLMRMTKVLKLIMENERTLPQQAKQPKKTIPDGVDEKIIEVPCFQEKFVPRAPRKLFLTNEMPKDSVCTEVVIVGPYPTKGFVSRVKKEMNPECIYVIVDSSWKEDEIEKIKNENVIIKKVQTDDGYGIVHAKMYLVKYSNNETLLFFGSVNASENSIDNNSEFISSYWLHKFPSENSQDDIKDYFNKLKNGMDAGPLEKELKIDGNSYSTLFFPKILACRDDDVNSFKNWIRKGFFFIKYEPDSTLGTIPIVLKDDKINQKVMKKILKTLSLEKNSPKMVLRYPYASSRIKKIKEENNDRNWRAKYAVTTDMGYWVSYDCMQALKNANKCIPPSNKFRTEIVNFIKKLNAEQQTIGTDLYKKIKNAKIERYLDIQKRDKFSVDLKEKIQYDQTLLEDKVYRDRYLTGYAQISASMLNIDFLDRIIENFIDTYIIKSKKKKGKRKILVNEIAKLEEIVDASTKIDKIEELWKKDKQLFKDYYK